MHLPPLFFTLAAVAASLPFTTASPLEKRAAQSCSVSSVHNVVTAVYKPSAVPFCNSYLGVSTKTVTTQITQTASGAKSTVTMPTTVTSVVVQTSTVKTTVQSVQSTTSTAPVAKRAAVTPSRLRSLSPAMLSSVCGCLTTSSTTTVTNTVTVAPTSISTQYTTSTALSTSTTTSTQTVTATPTPFYLKITNNTSVNVSNQFGYVGSETMTFVTTKASASKFTLDSAGHLISSTNNGIANMQNGAMHSTLFFDTADVVAQYGLVMAVCQRTGTSVNTAGKTVGGILECTDQSADSLFWCQPASSGNLVIAKSGYGGAGCMGVTLSVVNA